MSDAVTHFMGLAEQVGSRRRQRCSWCGHLLVDEDLAGMAWTLNEDGTDPGPPPPWQPGTLVEVAGDDGREATATLTMRSMRVVDEDEWPDSESGEGKAVPFNCCARLDPEVTA